MAKKRRELKVVFDTNILFTQSFGELMKPDVAQMMAEHSKHLDLDISWHLPEIVRHERQYQLEREAYELLPAMGKIEKLLTHKLNITESNLAECVKKSIDSAIEKHGLTILPTNPDDIDWAEVMMNSVYRRAPFDPGKSEKGFRDAMIAEAVLQLIKASPKTPSICRIVLVANDARLREAVEKRTQDYPNVRVVPDLEELKGFINTLVSQVSEDVVADIRARAKTYFFEKDEENYLYKKEGVGKKIRELFSIQLAEKPEEGLTLEQGTWFIFSPEFKKKENQRFFWASRVKVDVSAFRQTNQPTTRLSDLLSSTNTPQSPALAGLLGLGTSKKQVFSGEINFSVEWSVNVNAKKKFLAPKIEDVKYVQTIWTPTP